MEINVREARSRISSLLDRAQNGEEIIIIRRGQRVARLVPAYETQKRLPDLSSFRGTIRMKGGALSETVVQARDEER